MNALLIAAFSLALAPVKVNVNVKSGDVIMGDRKFKVSVEAENPINKVEFYVNGEFRSEATSVPYGFAIDTLAEKEGAIELKFKAYSSESETGEFIAKVTVDNGLNKGVDFHFDLAVSALQNGKNEEAIQEGRIMLKIDPKSNKARLILARANYSLKIYDQAQKYAEDAVAQDPSFAEAYDALAAINLQRAFKVTSRNGDARETLKTITSAFKAGVSARRKSLDLTVDNFPATVDKKSAAYLDACLRANRYSLVIRELAAYVDVHPDDIAAVNRIAFAYLRSGQTKEAQFVIAKLAKAGALDAYSYALKAVVETEMGAYAEATKSIREGIVAEAGNLAVSTAEAFLALKRGRDDSLGPQSVAAESRAGEFQIRPRSRACSDGRGGSRD